MIKIQEATKQAINHIEQNSRVHLSERSLKIAEEAIAKMRKILKSKKYAKNNN